MDPLRVAENEKKYVLHSWMAQKDFKPFIIAGGEGAVFGMIREKDISTSPPSSLM